MNDGYSDVNFDVVVVGAGPAGMAAAIAASKRCCVLLIERNAHLGGILKQCIHDGFGLVRFGETLTGPEYAARYAEMLRNTDIKVVTNAIVTQITPNREVIYITRIGIVRVNAGAVILCTGCRERTRGMLVIPGTRPAGIYTAGVVQNLINVRNIKPGNRAVILGSGDIGMIMARRMTLEGMAVVCVLEKQPQLTGLIRNKYQCLDDYNIPLHLNRTVTQIQGYPHIERVIVCNVDDEGNHLADTQYQIDCDVLILSVGLIPENEIAEDCGAELNPQTNGPIINDKLETSVRGIFSAGNSLHIHSLADYASEEGALAGQFASEFALGGKTL